MIDPVNREAWLDNVKMFAMILVIAIHTIGHFGDMDTWRYSAVAEWINSFNMQMFTMLAGYTTWHSFSKINTFESLCNFGEKIFYRMVLPAVIFSSIPQIEKHLLFARKLWVVFAVACIFSYYIIKLYNNKASFFLLVIKIVTITFLLVSSLWLNMYWFIAMLMKIQCIGAFLMLFSNNIGIRALKNCKHWIVLILLMYIPAFFLLDSYTLEMIPYFIIGLILSSYNVRPRNIRYSKFVALATALVGFSLLPKIYGLSFYNVSPLEFIVNGNISLFLARICCALCLSFSVITLIALLSKKYNLFSKMGSYSLSFYLIQEIFLMYIVYPFININGNPLLMWGMWLVAMAAFTILLYWVIFLFNKFPITRALLLGKSNL